MSALKVEYGLFALQATRPLLMEPMNNTTMSSVRRWRELEVVRALYEGSSEVLARSERTIEIEAS